MLGSSSKAAAKELARAARGRAGGSRLRKTAATKACVSLTRRYSSGPPASADRPESSHSAAQAAPPPPASSSATPTASDAATSAAPSESLDYPLEYNSSLGRRAAAMRGWPTEEAVGKGPAHAAAETTSSGGHEGVAGDEAVERLSYADDSVAAYSRADVCRSGGRVADRPVVVGQPKERQSSEAAGALRTLAPNDPQLLPKRGRHRSMSTPSPASSPSVQGASRPPSPARPPPAPAVRPAVIPPLTWPAPPSAVVRPAPPPLVAAELVHQPSSPKVTTSASASRSSPAAVPALSFDSLLRQFAPPIPPPVPVTADAAARPKSRTTEKAGSSAARAGRVPSIGRSTPPAPPVKPPPAVATVSVDPPRSRSPVAPPPSATTSASASRSSPAAVPALSFDSLVRQFAAPSPPPAPVTADAAARPTSRTTEKAGSSATSAGRVPPVGRSTPPTPPIKPPPETCLPSRVAPLAPKPLEALTKAPSGQALPVLQPVSEVQLNAPVPLQALAAAGPRPSGARVARRVPPRAHSPPPPLPQTASAVLDDVDADLALPEAPPVRLAALLPASTQPGQGGPRLGIELLRSATDGFLDLELAPPSAPPSVLAREHRSEELIDVLLPPIEGMSSGSYVRSAGPQPVSARNIFLDIERDGELVESQPVRPYSLDNHQYYTMPVEWRFKMIQHLYRPRYYSPTPEVHAALWGFEGLRPSNLHAIEKFDAAMEAWYDSDRSTRGLSFEDCLFGRHHLERQRDELDVHRPVARRALGSWKDRVAARSALGGVEEDVGGREDAPGEQAAAPEEDEEPASSAPPANGVAPAPPLPLLPRPSAVAPPPALARGLPPHIAGPPTLPPAPRALPPAFPSAASAPESAAAVSSGSPSPPAAPSLVPRLPLASAASAQQAPAGASPTPPARASSSSPDVNPKNYLWRWESPKVRQTLGRKTLPSRARRRSSTPLDLLLPGSSSVRKADTRSAAFPGGEAALGHFVHRSPLAMRVMVVERHRAHARLLAWSRGVSLQRTVEAGGWRFGVCWLNQVDVGQSLKHF